MEKMTVKGLVNACIAEYAGSRERYRHGSRGAGAMDMLLHMVMVSSGLDEEEAAEWLAEELQDRFAAMAD